MIWTADGPMAGFDTETTGVDPTECRLVTATVTQHPTGGGGPDGFGYLVAVDVDIPAAATAVHGITTEQARAEGWPLVKVVEQVTEQLALTWASRVPVVGMNVAYDFTVLAYETHRVGLPAFKIRGPVIDVQVIDKAVDKFRRGKRTLTDLCAFYGVPLEDAHNATADAVAAVGVARAMAQRAALAVVDPDQVAALYADRKSPRGLVRAWQRLAGMPLGELFVRQQGWYADQASSYAGYLRQQAVKHEQDAGQYDEGDPDGDSLQVTAEELRARSRGVSSEWPVRTRS